MQSKPLFSKSDKNNTVT